MTKVYISNKDATAYVEYGSIGIEDSINERSTCSFVLNVPTSILTINSGEKVEIIEGTTVLFGGTINDYNKSLILGSKPTQVKYDIQCTDWHQICDRRIVSEAFANMTAGAILTSLVEKYLSLEGITGDIDEGPTVVEAVFNYIPFTSCVEKLAEISGFNWWISPDKILHFKNREALLTQISITNKSPIFNVKVSGNRDKYRNRQFIKAGKDVTDLQTETFKGNGSQKTFTVGFPLAVEPGIRVNEVDKTVGIRGIDTNKDWYWNKGDPSITQDEGAIALTEQDAVSISYKGMFDIVTITYDIDAVDRRKSAEGGTGYYDHVEEEPYLTSRDAAFQSATAKLRRFSKMNKVLTFNTLETLYHPGQIVNVGINLLNLAGEYLIQKVSYKHFYKSGYEYEIQAVSGEAVDGWVKMFKDITEQSKTWVIRENISENQVIVILETFEKTWVQNEALNIFKIIYPGSVLFPGNSSFPSFEYIDRVKYLAWLDADGAELGRKAITKQTGEDTDEIVSTTYIAPFEANVSIGKLAWIGGWNATEAKNTGIRVHEVVFNKNKSLLESLQIVKTDRKGW